MTRYDTLYRFIIFLTIGIAIRETLADEPEAIVSGYIAIEGEFPFVVGLRYDRTYRCGGCIISRKHILTAAHCVHKRDADRFIIRTGTIWREWYGQYYYVSHISVHPDWEVKEARKHAYDIAVLTLTSPIVLDDMNTVIPIASVNTPAGVKAEVIGWGQTKTKGEDSEIQRKSYLHTISNYECQLRIGAYMMDSQLCTEEPKGTGSCIGDSGSPLVYNNEVVGITSWVYPCALGLPDTFTRVYSFRWFIRDAMNKHP